MSFENDVMIEI